MTDNDVRTLYRIPVPYAMGDSFVVVYGDPEMAWYEWRIETAGKVTKDTKEQGYGSPEIALRDALCFCAPLG